MIDNARALAPWLLGEAARIEEARRIPDDVAERLVDAGLFRLAVPRAYGGYGASPEIVWRAIFEIANGCASSAWIVGLTCANLLVAARFGRAAQDDLFGFDAPPIMPLLTGGVGQEITVRDAAGGLAISGTWRYASGIDVASWVGLLVTQPDDAAPVLALVPRSAFTIDHDSWRVMGMRGTGSKTIHLAPTVVPHHRTMDWARLQAGKCHDTCPNTEPAYRFPLNALLAMSVLAPTLGVASAVADEYGAIVRKRVSAGTKQRQIEDKIAHVSVASGTATMAMLRAFLVAETRRLETEIAAGAQPSLVERGLLRMKMAIAARQAVGEAQSLFASVGGSLLPEGTRIERQFRDLHAMASHFLLQPEPVGEAYGRLLLGLELPPGARL